MPARRRLPDSQSDDTIKVIVDDDTEEKKKYSKSNTVANSSTGSKWNNWGSFIQQQLSTGYETLVQQHQQFYSQQPTQFVNNYNTNQQQTQLLKNVSDKDLHSFDDSQLDTGDTEIVVMTARDRTTEFGNAIRSLQGRNIARAVNIRDPRKAVQLQSYSEFMMIAKHVGRNIASTYTKLEKLTLCMNIFVTINILLEYFFFLY